MPRFRKKPVVIEAVQYREQDRRNGILPDGVYITPWEGTSALPPGDYPTIHTLEGHMRVTDGDWIITGIAGEKYPCKDFIFQGTYEPAE